MTGVGAMGDQRSSAASVAAIIGTRPEAIKMAPVLRALRAHGVDAALICTGQHPTLDLPGCGIGQAPTSLLPLDPHHLTADAMCDAASALAADWLAKARPDLVLVQGDTNSALAGARAADACGIAVAHVEAGLRTGNPEDPWPEERNRIEIDARARLLFAPTATACRNLEAEAVRGKVILSGNSGVDALVETAFELPSRRRCGAERLLLVTVHRRENRGAGIAAVGEALRRIAREEAVCFAVPLHPNSAARAEMIAATAGVPNLRLLKPQSYRDMVALMLESSLILSDSGGLQEEAPALGRPLLILRASTERPEAITSGNAIRVGTEPHQVAGEALRLLRDEGARARMSVPAFPFGTGGASKIIAGAVAEFLGRSAPA